MGDDTATEEEVDKNHRMMFAYLAGLITGDEQLRELYEREHKTHERRYSNCAICEICETDAAMGMFRETTWLSRIKKEPTPKQNKPLAIPVVIGWRSR